MILMGPWTEFYFMAKSLPILITAGAIVVIGVIVLLYWLWDLFTKLVHKITTRNSKEEDDGERSDQNDESSS